MNEETKYTDIKEKEESSSIKRSARRREAKKRKKKKSFLFRVILMVVLLCVAVFGAIILSDVVSRKSVQKETAVVDEKITITISSDSIYLDGDNKITLERLRRYLEIENKDGKLPVVCLVNDTSNPASYILYNQVADLLSEFDVHIERMQPPATADELQYSTKDEETP